MQQTAYARIVYERQSRRKAVAVARPRNTFRKYAKEACRSIVAFLFTQVGVCALVVAYNVVGAFAFQALEGFHGDTAPEHEAQSAQDSAVLGLWNVTLHLNVLEEKRWREEIRLVLKEYQDTVIPLIKTRGYRGLSSQKTWSFSACLMYSLSIYTTIGYGNMTPRTDWGKLTTIFYAIVGMPLMLLYMSNVGDVLANVFKFLYFKACRCNIGSLGYYRSESGTIRPISLNSKANGSPSDSFSKPNELILEVPSQKKTIPITWCLLVIAVYVIFGGIIFSQWEGWSLLNGSYFCYISLSTVGFGDMVPGRTVAGDYADKEVEYKQVLCTIYLLVGMALVAMCFSLMQEEALENLKAFWRNLGCLRKKNEKNQETK